MKFIAKIVSSNLKKAKLVKLMKRLGQDSSLSQMAEQVMHRAIHGETTDKDLAKSELFDFVESDPNLQETMQRYGATRETLKEIYRRLSLHIGGWKRGVYMPAAAVATSLPLRYILSNLSRPSPYDEPNQWLDITSNLHNYFHSGRADVLESKIDLPYEVERAVNFSIEATASANRFKENVQGQSRLLDSLTSHELFVSHYVIVALDAAYSAAKITFEEGSHKVKHLYPILIMSVLKSNQNAEANIESHLDFLDGLEKQGRMETNQASQASGYWIIMALTTGAKLDSDISETLETARIIGQGIYSDFSDYWREEAIPIVGSL